MTNTIIDPIIYFKERNSYFFEPLHDGWHFTKVNNIATKGPLPEYVRFGITEQCRRYGNIYNQPSYLDFENYNLLCCR